MPDSSSPALTRNARIAIFLAVVLVAVGASAVYVRRAQGRTTTQLAAVSPAPEDAGTKPIAALAGDQHFLFRDAAPTRDAGRVALTAFAHPGLDIAFTPLQCDRVDYAANRGICLSLNQRRITVASKITIFDNSFNTVATVRIPGLPSRARVSPDGRYGAITVFVNGDSYSELGFSTRTTVIDMNTGAVVLDLEKLTVRDGGGVIRDVTANFWGVTFAKDGRTFYATLGRGGETFLIQGDLITKQAHVLRSGVECPMLSPDGTRIAFKKRVDEGIWRLSVLDLKTLADHPVADTRNIDDQPQWLDDTTVMYGVTRPIDPNKGAFYSSGMPIVAQGTTVTADTWVAPADGSGAPRKLLDGSWSTSSVIG